MIERKRILHLEVLDTDIPPILEYLQSIDPAYAVQFLEAFEKALSRIEKYPLAHSRYFGAYRRIVLVPFL